MIHETAQGLRLDLSGATAEQKMQIEAGIRWLGTPGNTYRYYVNLCEDRAHLIPGGGIVTPAVLKTPLYRAFSDLIFRFELRMKGRTIEQEIEAYTVPIADAAKQLGVTPEATRKAIHEQRLAAWKHYIPGGVGNQWYVLPAAIEALKPRTIPPQLPQ